MPLKTELKPHQARVVQKIQDPNRPGLVVAHGLGSGKTLTAIAAQEALGMPADVLLPAALQANYAKEQKKHLSGTPPRADVATLQRAALNRSAGTNPLLIVDEAHRARETSGATYQTLKNNKAQKRLLLTGSPFYNRPSDISALVNIAAGRSVLPDDPQQFKRKFIEEVKTNPGLLGRVMGAKPGVTERINPHQIKAMRDVLQQWVDYHPGSEEDFPSVTRETVKVPMTDEQLKVYDSVLGTAPAWVRYKIRQGLPPSKQELAQLNAFSTGARQISNSTIGHAPNAQAQDPKIQTAYDRLKTKLDEDPAFKAIVYSNYLDTGVAPYRARLAAGSVPFGEYTGEMKRQDRDQLVRDYNDGKKRVILLSSAGGEGLDLKGTRLVQLLEPHWNNEKLRQVEGRAIRYQSHAGLPEDQRNVRVENYLATRPAHGMLQRAGFAKPGLGIDEYLTGMSADKDKLINQFKALLPAEEVPNVRRPQAPALRAGALRSQVST